MDVLALRVERLRQDLEGKRFAIDMLARRHIALLAVSFTVGASGGLAGLANQVAAGPAALTTATAAGGFLLEFRALRQLSEQWDLACEEAARATDSLIASGGDTEDDAESAPTAPGVP